VKTNNIGKRRAINKVEMRNNVAGFIRSRKKDKKQVKKYLHVSRVR